MTKHNIPFSVTGLDHVVLRAQDAPGLVAFYINCIGCKLVWERPDLGLWHLGIGNAMLDIVSFAGPLGQSGVSAPAGLGRNVDHICVTIDKFDFDKISKHFACFGIEIDYPKSRYGAKGYGDSIYIRDPEGNGVELKRDTFV
ncbi:VOC family protein [Novosphingobium piscinae]|uniref:VOC family protein n=1 Tax=Novosphingobium piscinae TaxID=1507448 RepID=A0A7X1KQ81_9SPHN|nr:VOC family protein [Novosphingobium piscinae]MBC2669522.1 VOC family protein [Novosphingobium piscinae]